MRRNARPGQWLGRKKVVCDLAQEVEGLHRALDPEFNMDNCDVFRRAMAVILDG